MTADTPKLRRYVIVSPVKDEERFAEAAILSVLHQTLRPMKWIVVDDGSSDGTPAILAKYAAEHDWIETIRINRDATRDLGVTEIRAFSKGSELVADLDWGMIVKLDCDVTLPENYFEKLVEEFERNDNLGIASGVYLEQTEGEWVPVSMPEYHAAGASKMVRRECYEAIGGFALCRGWDTIDEIKAQARGWQTCHFPQLQFRHNRREGSALGFVRTNLLHGEVYYTTGGGAAFFALKVLHRMAVGKPLVAAGLTMFWGYSRCLLSSKERAVTASEAQVYRRMLNGRLFDLAKRTPTRLEQA